MNELTKKQTLQILKNCIEGLYGDESQAMAYRYHQDNNSPMRLHLQFVKDFYQKVESEQEKEPAYAIAQNIVLYLLVFYRDLHKKSPPKAEMFLTGLVMDYPGVAGSKLLGQFQGLVEAAIAFKRVIPYNDYLPLWQQSQKLIQAYNEFLGGLIGYLIIGFKVLLDMKHDPRKILHSSYGNKVHEFNEITHGILIELTNLAQPKLRNALAHGGVWHDRETDNVHYQDRDKEYEMPLINFIAFGSAGSYLCESYIVALSAVLIMYYSSDETREQLPIAVKEIFYQ